MGTDVSYPRVRSRRWWVVVLSVVAAVFILAAPAAAAPPPTLGLDGLQTQLDLHGSLDGVMKTTLSGSTPVDIPVKVLAIVDGFSWGKLVMFESTDARVVDNGGIAAGMSGSPITVDVGGTSYLIGAVSYGDWFTLRGTGLATPIEYMTAVQAKATAKTSAAAGTSVRLDRPVATAAGKVSRLMLGTAATAAAATDGTAVMHPLALARISGLPTGSKDYKKLAAKLEDSGLTVVPGQTSGAVTATPALGAGSPCGVVFSGGDFVLSVLGTVTYVDGDTALLFGHPILGGYSGYELGMGPIEGALTGAVVQGVWPSTIDPYKMMSPADTKGVAVQDTSAGTLAHIGGDIGYFPITTHATLDGGATVSNQTDLGHWFATTYYPEIADDWGEGGGATTGVAAAGLYHALGSDLLVGSAVTTTTIVLNDGVKDYTVSHDNVWDNNGDYSWMGLGDAAAGDVATMMAKLLTDPYGTRDITIKSVDVTAAFSSTSRYAGISDATTPRAIRAGKNFIDVTYYRYGSVTPQTVHAELDIPAGTDLYGYLEVSSAGMSDYYYYDEYYEGADAPETVDDTIDAIKALPNNGDVVIAYYPNESEEEEESDDWEEPKAAGETIVPSDWVFSGYIHKETAQVTLSARHKVIDPGEPVQVAGFVNDADENVPVALYVQEAGKAEPAKPFKTLKTTKKYGMYFFGAVVPPARHNLLVTAEVPALEKDSLPGAAQRVVEVRATLGLSAARHGGKLLLTAHVRPGDAAGTVVFQKRAGGHWRTVGKATVVGGAAEIGFRAGSTSEVRARYTGGDTNAASTWTTRAIH